jgi:NADH:ubiquinone oxidoreductase subunit 6 (subunit J)
VVENTKAVETGLTAAALAITFVLLILAAWWVRRESVAGMVVIIIVYFIALAYFLFKLVRMYITDQRRQQDYKPARKSLTSFAVLTILLLLVTIVIACICTKEDVDAKNATEMPYVSGPAPGAARMEID